MVNLNNNSSACRWLKFNVIGVFGFVLQTAVLALLEAGFALPSMLATAVATEVALLHNFSWHQRITWPESRGSETGRRLLLFHAGNGLVSLVGNSAIVWLLADVGHIHYLLANTAAVLVCSFANFMIGDRVVFRSAPSLSTP